MKNWGVCSRLAELTGFSRDVFYIWLGRKQTRYSQTPSLETILEFCYACNVTPLQVMPSADTLLHAIWDETLPRYRRSQRFTRNRVDRGSAQELLQSVLDGCEKLTNVKQLAQRLGHLFLSMILGLILILSEPACLQGRKKRRECTEASMSRRRNLCATQDVES